MRIDYARYSPPGHSVSAWKGYTTFALAGSASFSFLTFMIRMVHALEELQRHRDKLMPPFREILGTAQLPFLLFAGGSLVFVLTFYLYFRQGAKRIYTMRRLSNRWELHRRCWVLPLFTIAALLFSSFILELFYFLLYLIAAQAEFRFWGR